MTTIKCEHTLYNNTNINTKACYQNAQSYMCIEPLQYHKHKQKGYFPKYPVWHVNIPSTTT